MGQRITIRGAALDVTLSREASGGLLCSISKSLYPKAVTRNTIKRRIHETYRSLNISKDIRVQVHTKGKETNFSIIKKDLSAAYNTMKELEKSNK